jgi:hypothetical protein
MNRSIRTSRFLLALLAALTAATARAQEQATYIVQAASLDLARAHVRRAGAEPERDLDIIRAVAVQLTPQQLAGLHADAGVRVFEDREVRARGTLLGGLTDVVNDLNSTLAESSLVQTVQTVTAPLVSTVACNALVSTVTDPLVGTLQAVQDSTSLASLTLAYETNYPAMIGADQLHCRGITGRGVTIAVLDTGLWRDTFQFYGNRIRASLDVTFGGRSGPVTGTRTVTARMSRRSPRAAPKR